MQKEMWLGKWMQVHEVMNSKDCERCVFYNTDRCREISCTPDAREDSKSVFFSEIVDAPEVDQQYTAHTARCWEQFAAQEVRNTEYYQGVLDQIGDMLGIAAYTADDGIVHSSVLRAKVPELVAKLVYENVCLKARVQQLEVFDL